MKPSISEAISQDVVLNDFLNVLCYRNQNKNMFALRKSLGDATFLSILDKFSGTFVKFATASSSIECIQELYLAALYQAIKIKKKQGDLRGWNDCETRFVNAVNRMGLKYQQAWAKAASVQKEIGAAQQWITRMHEVEKGLKMDIEA